MEPPGAREPGRAAAGHQPVHARLAGPHRRDEDAGTAPGPSSCTASTPRSAGAAPATKSARAPRSASSRCAAPAMAGTRSSNAPKLWNLFNTRKHAGQSLRVFPLSNWTEFDVWQYIYRENIPIVPPVLRRAAAGGRARRPTHHGRRRAHAAAPGRGCRCCARCASATLGCYPLTSATESQAATLPEIIGELLNSRRLGAPGPAHRPRRQRVDGEEKSGGLLLSALPSEAEGGDPHAADIEPPACAPMSARACCASSPAAASTTARSTLIGRLLHESHAPLRRPARRARRRLQIKWGTQGRRDRLRARRRRAGGRARTGHHDRRRVPLLLDRVAQVHRCRHARS